jgi:hypothetical protein
VSACRRFETEGLLLMEQGLALDEHFQTCPDCVAARRAVESVRSGLAGLARADELPAGWEGRVWTAIDRRPARSGRRRWIWLPAAAAAAVVLVAVLRIGAPRSGGAGLDVAVESGGITYRGQGMARPGDVLRLRAKTGGARAAELRVYRNDRSLVVGCSAEPPCQREDGTIDARVVLGSVGSFQPVLLLSDRPLPTTTGGLDQDVGSARATGARIHLGTPVVVR